MLLHIVILTQVINMENINLYKIFTDISDVANDGNHFKVTAITNTKHKIGKSDEGYPKFFVQCCDVNPHIHNSRAEVLSVEYNVDCSVIENEKETSDACFSIITLRSDDISLQRLFIEVFYLMIETLPDYPTNYDLSLKIEGLLSIFSALKRKPIHKIQGLWAELLVIERSKNPELMANAWHTIPAAKYDFTQGCDKIEVKSTSSEERIHKFSLDQLNPTESSNLLIASVIVRESAEDENGLSVMDLYDKICKRVSNIDARMHIYSVMVNTLGNEYDKAANVFFDYSQGKDSLQFFDYRDVPHIEKDDVPVFVTGVRFNSDLSHLKDAFSKGYEYLNNQLYKILE